MGKQRIVKGQMSMFEVEDLPLWSGTPVEVQDSAFNPSPVAVEPEQMSFEHITLAKAAFYGQNEALMEYLEDKDGYEMDGIWYPSNGMSLNRAIELVRGLSAAELEAFN